MLTALTSIILLPPQVGRTEIVMNAKMEKLGSTRSVIREIFEYGNKRRSEIGADKVFDFSLGNPSVPAPQDVADELISLIKNTPPVKLHGYTSAQGDMNVRKAVSEYIERRYNRETKPLSSPELIYMTSGAAAALTCSLSAILNEGDEVIVFTPFFPEYRIFIERTGASLVEVPCDENRFYPNTELFRNAINEKTAAVIINSPNNPSGAVYPESVIKDMADILREKEAKLGKSIYIIADEPYRELVYGDITVPYIPSYYDDTVVCYSLSKSLSLPGERIGYVSISPRAKDASRLFNAVCGAGRALGFVCATSLFQYMLAETLGKTSDISVYQRNRDKLYRALTEYGFEAVRPDGAFYLFVKSPTADAGEFCEKAKEYELLLVPSDDFGIGGYVRISYCVSEEQIDASLASFKKLADAYRIK